MVLVSLQSYANYTFAVKLGNQVGLSIETVSVVQSVAFAVSIFGAWASKIGHSRLGRFWPLVASLVVALFANFFAARPPSAIVFEVAVITCMVASFFHLPYLCSYATAIDHTGKGATILTGVFVIGCAVASAIAGYGIDLFGLGVLGISSIVSYAVCI